ncbi:cytochrome P450 [Mesonia aestuariivivens]|uniref:Cytochrome P450 n=1 Tax=Mesonia aestuariivivens TaxID=2796128 RepID=A0ABS6W3L5_9FLAO|nr:cytochrome P450 [Mesonia aestuariivivens]MBW2962450.1 cytochrome P450 [Mesonia aestuariivivens]
MKKSQKIPEVSVFKFLKHATQIVENPLPFHLNNFQKLGDIFRLNLGFGKSVIFSRDPVIAQHLLQKNQKNYHKSPIQAKDLAKYVGQGLLTTNGEHWQKQRKLIQPAFHKKQLEKLMGTVHLAIQKELDKIKTDREFDIFPIFNDLAFQTVVKSLFSSAIGEKEINRLQYITEAAQKMLVSELRQPYRNWWFRLSGKIQQHLDLTQEARQILKAIVEKRKNSLQREDDLLDMLLDARYDDATAMDEEQLIDEILILFTAGHETTSNALTFTCELLARHPKIQQKLYEDILLAKENSSNLMQFLQQSAYANLVISESMRLYPPAYFIDRISLAADEVAGVKIGSDESLLLSIYEIHRHKDHWEQPEQFIPERFAEGKQRKNIAYYPFGAGPRKCIGNNFAMYEMILAVSEVMLKFKIKPKKAPIQILPLITLKPRNAFLNFTKR